MLLPYFPFLFLILDTILIRIFISSENPICLSRNTEPLTQTIETPNIDDFCCVTGEIRDNSKKKFLRMLGWTTPTMPPHEYAPVKVRYCSKCGKSRPFSIRFFY